jgi:hypothetical protein
VAALERFQARVHKPVVFTEVGYRSAADAAAEPWKWESSAEADFEAQANSYEALFRTFSGKRWLEGIYIWKWYPAPERSRRPLDRDFTPQGKPAEKVLAKWFSR